MHLSIEFIALLTSFDPGDYRSLPKKGPVSNTIFTRMDAIPRLVAALELMPHLMVSEGK